MPSALPPTPVVFVRDGDLLSAIREQITAPPDPRVLPWAPSPDYDAQAVTVRARLDRAAKAKKEELANAPPPPEAPKRVESAFGTVPRPSARAEGPVDFSTLGSFIEKTELTAPAPRKAGAEPFPPPETEPERPASAFGFAQGAFRPKKKAEDEKKPEQKRRPRADEDDFLGRLKTEFRKE